VWQPRGNRNLSVELVVGRLSALVDAFDAWAEPRYCRPRRPPSSLPLVLGAAHPVVSLVRYMAALSTMTRPSRRQRVAVPASPPARGATGDAVQLGPDVRVLSDIHDCAVLLERFKRAHAGRSPAARCAGPGWRGDRGCRADPGASAPGHGWTAQARRLDRVALGMTPWRTPSRSRSTR